MNKIEQIESQLNWYQKQLDHPLLAHLLSSVIIFWFVGLIMTLIDSEIVIAELSFGDILIQIGLWGISGFFLGLVNRFYANYQLKRLKKKKETLLSEKN